jgi:hypothetical protein
MSTRYSRRQILKAGGIGALAMTAGAAGMPAAKAETTQDPIDEVKSSDFPRNDGETDDTKRLQRLIAASEAAGWVPIHLNENNTYVISDTIFIESGDRIPHISGNGFRRTVIKGENLPAGKPAIKIRGGSGRMTGGKLFGIGFYGNTYSIGVELAGTNGFHIEFCQFDLNRVGILFHNEQYSEFTEWNVAMNCDFRSACNTAVQYRQSNGVESFHGSGIKGCTINQGAEETEPKIRIGEGCYPFNAPLEFNIWTRKATPIIKNEGTEPASFHGNISIESFDQNGNDYKTELVSTAGSPVYMIGAPSALDDQSKLGNMVLCDQIQVNPDRSVSVHRKKNQNVFNVTTGSNLTIPISNGTSSIVTVSLKAENYEYSYTLLAHRNEGDDKGSVTTLSMHNNHNAAMYYAPTFSVESGKLAITNNNYPESGVTAYVTMLDIGGLF